MFNINKKIKRLANGEIWLCDDIMNRIDEIKEKRCLVELPPLTENDVKKRIGSANFSIECQLLKKLDIMPYTKNMGETWHTILLSTYDEEQEYTRLYDLMKCQKENCNAISGMKSTLTKRKNNIETQLIKGAWYKEYKEKVLPELLLHLYEFYKVWYDKLDENFMFHKNKRKQYEQEFENLKEELKKKYGKKFI